MAEGPVEVVTAAPSLTGASTRTQQNLDKMNENIEAARRMLEATRNSVKETMNSISQVQDVNRAAGESLRQSSEALEARMTAARAALDIANENMAASLDSPRARQMLLEAIAGGSVGSPVGHSSSSSSSSWERPKQCIEVDEDADLQRALAESLATFGVASVPPATWGSDDDDDEELRRAIAASLEPTSPR